MATAGDDTPMTMDPSVRCEQCGGFVRVADGEYVSFRVAVDEDHPDGNGYKCNSCVAAKVV